LPYNFNSPYQASNIIDFWRRWHMTLSRFLRDYLYVGLGGNRRGSVRRYFNLMVTMVLGGLWHGAGWTFLIWGALHGIYLMVNHAWLAIRSRLGLKRSFGSWGTWAGRLVTLVAVMIGWVFFRATDADAAVSMLKAMGGVHGWLAVGDPIAQVLEQARHLGIIKTVAHWLDMLSVLLFLAVAWVLPNSQQIVDGLGGRSSSLEICCSPPRRGRHAWPVPFSTPSARCRRSARSCTSSFRDVPVPLPFGWLWS